MAEKTGNGDPWQPMAGAEPARITQLGALLKLRRAELGYRHLPAFVRDRRINTRMAGDIEHGRRDTYTYPSLHDDVAPAYAVTYKSLVDVAWGKADKLAPAPAAPVALPVAGEPPGWMAGDEDRSAATRPYADQIEGRLALLRAQGTRVPSGEQLFPDSPADAADWDKHPDWGIRDRVWFVADLQRQSDGRRTPNSGTGVTSA